MRPSKQAVNPCLAVLVEGAGFSSIEKFAEAVNARAWHSCGMQLSYDHVSVKRWIRGGTCQYPEVVAAVLSDAWGIEIPVGVIWPELRNGSGPVPAHFQAWVAARTLEDLGVFVRCDMLTRRDLLADTIGIVSGTALMEPINRWLPRPPTGIPATIGAGARIDLTTVIDIELANQHLSATDAGIGGGPSREAAVGQLKYAVDLMQHGSYTEYVGNRLLATIARLANGVGWMCHDVGMEGPAQRYFTYGLHAARESTHERAPLVAVGILADMARQMRSLGHPDTGLGLINQALDLVPPQRRDHAPARAMLLNLKARMLASMGTHTLPEMRNILAASFDLYESADHGEWTWQTELFPYVSEAELAGEAASAYRDLAHEAPALADQTEQYAQRALASRPGTFVRSRAFDQIGLARARFMQGEPEQACKDAETAIRLSAEVPSSTRVRSRLKELVRDSQPYRDIACVKELHDRLHLAISPA